MAKNIYSLQLLRNSNIVSSYTEAIDAITGATTQDGVIKLARYYQDGTDVYSGDTKGAIKTIFGIYHEAKDGKEAGYTIYESYKELIDDIQSKIDAMGGASGSIAQQIQNAINNLDYTGYTAADSKVVTSVTETDGIVAADGKNITEVVLTGYEAPTTTNTDNTLPENKVGATDDLGTAIEKLQKQINSMDKAASATDGQVVTTVANADGIITETKANVKDLQLGGYAKEAATVSGAVGSTDTINTAISKLENNIAALSGSTDAKIEALDATATTTASQVFDQITQTNGLVAATPKLATTLVMEGLAATADTKIDATDTLGQALAKLQGQIDSMDKSSEVANGQVVTTVTQADGKVTETKANVKDLQLGGYAKDASATGSIASTDTINAALSKLENKVGANKITNADHSIVVTEPTGTATTTDIKVNIKSGENVIKLGADGIYTNLNLVKITTGLGATVKESYEFRDSDGNKIGESIDIAKDSHIVSITYDETTQKLIYKYLDASGVEQTTEVDMAHLILETEVENGIQSVNGKLSVKLDTTGDDTGDGKFLTVGANGLKLDGVTDAINAAIDALDVADSAVTGQYVSAVSETDGKVSISRANVSEAVLNNYAKGAAPAAANSAITATDTINAALAKLEHQVDAAKAAATTKVVEGTDTAGVMTIDENVADSGNTYTINLSNIAKADAVGLGTDGSHVTTQGAYTSEATTIAGEIAALDTALNTVSGKVDDAQAEINTIETGAGLNNDGTYSPDATNTYTSGAISLADAIDKLDDAAASLSGNFVSGATMNGTAVEKSADNNTLIFSAVYNNTAANDNTNGMVITTDNNGGLAFQFGTLDAGTY